MGKSGLSPKGSLIDSRGYSLTGAGRRALEFASSQDSAPGPNKSNSDDVDVQLLLWTDPLIPPAQPQASTFASRDLLPEQ